MIFFFGKSRIFQRNFFELMIFLGEIKNISNNEIFFWKIKNISKKNFGINEIFFWKIKNISIKNENHSIFATSESFVNPLGNWGFGICLGWFWCSKIVKKSFLIKKNRFLVNLRHFYNTYLNIVKNNFPPKIFFG